MADIPEQDNQQAEAFNAAIHSAVFDVGITGAQMLAQARFPWLKLPIVSQLFGLALRWQAGFFYRAFAKMGTFHIIDAQTAEEKIAFDRAWLGLQAATAVGTPEDEWAAQEEFKAAVTRLVRFDGAAPID